MPLSREGSSPERIHFIDELRGLDIILMVLYHLIYTLGFLFDIAWCRDVFIGLAPISPLFAGLFIFLCGLSCRLSHSNLRRGSLLLLIAVGISVGMWFFSRWMDSPDLMIWFGILHFLAVAILLFVPLRPVLDRLSPAVGLLICALCFWLTWGVPASEGGFVGLPGIVEWSLPSSWMTIPWLYPLGLSYLPSADYFPLLPWIFCFLAGSFVGVWARDGRFPAWMYRQRLPVLSTLGRHTLWIYVLHQPVIYGVGYLLIALVNLFK